MAVPASLSLVAASLVASMLVVGCTSTIPSPSTSGVSSGAPLPQESTASATPPAPATVAPSASPPEPTGEASCDSPSGALPAGAACLTSFVSTDAPAPPFARFVVPAKGWNAFNGAYKDVASGGATERVGALFVMISNLNVDACMDQQPADPPVGPTVDDLVSALVALRPFEVVEAPRAVTAFGTSGTYLQLRVPVTLPSDGFESFTSCRTPLLRSWISPGHVSSSFNGYTGPGDTEAFWIFDQDGKRLVVAALTSANASPALIAERQALLDSVTIEP